MLLLFNTPTYNDAIDHDGDGNAEQQWTDFGDGSSKLQADRNSDGKVDSVYQYNKQGLVITSRHDNDFNGSFETDAGYRFGMLIWSKSDTNGDGFKDYRQNYQYDTLDTATFLDPATKKPLKIQYFDAFKLSKTEIDTNQDGTLDIVHHDNNLEEPIPY